MSCPRTKNDINIKLIPTPRNMVLNAGTYHGRFAYFPVNPNQKIPMTSADHSTKESFFWRWESFPLLDKFRIVS